MQCALCMKKKNKTAPNFTKLKYLGFNFRRKETSSPARQSVLNLLKRMFAPSQRNNQMQERHSLVYKQGQINWLHRKECPLEVYVTSLISGKGQRWVKGQQSSRALVGYLVFDQALFEGSSCIFVCGGGGTTAKAFVAIHYILCWTQMLNSVGPWGNFFKGSFP